MWSCGLTRGETVANLIFWRKTGKGVVTCWHTAGFFCRRGFEVVIGEMFRILVGFYQTACIFAQMFYAFNQGGHVRNACFVGCQHCGYCVRLRAHRVERSSWAFLTTCMNSRVVGVFRFVLRFVFSVVWEVGKQSQNQKYENRRIQFCQDVSYDMNMLGFD